jgi:hypothetical protein
MENAKSFDVTAGHTQSHSVLILQCSVVTMYTTSVFLPTECIYVLPMILKINNNYFPIQD